MRILSFALACLLATTTVSAADDSKHGFEGLKLPGIGPPITSGRISDFAFDPGRKHEYFVATASGNLLNP
jgi:hypothetical protein